MRAIRWICLAIGIAVLITACSRTDFETVQTTKDSLLENHSESYIIIERENAFYVTVCDSKNLPFDELGPFPKEPEIRQVDEAIVLVSLQAGLGKETKWGVYFNLDEHRQSEVFYGILAEADNTVVYCNDSQIIIQDIFDASKFHQVFSSFPTELSPTATPFVSATFTNDNNGVMIAYLSGEDYHTELTTISLERSH